MENGGLVSAIMTGIDAIRQDMGEHVSREAAYFSIRAWDQDSGGPFQVERCIPVTRVGATEVARLLSSTAGPIEVIEFAVPLPVLCGRFKECMYGACGFHTVPALRIELNSDGTLGSLEVFGRPKELRGPEDPGVEQTLGRVRELLMDSLSASPSVPYSEASFPPLWLMAQRHAHQITGEELPAHLHA